MTYNTATHTWAMHPDYCVGYRAGYTDAFIGALIIFTLSANAAGTAIADRWDRLPVSQNIEDRRV